MRQIEYTETEKVHIVQELVDALGKSRKVDSENYLMIFSMVTNAMIEQLGHDKTKKERVANQHFAKYMNCEFLPQYAIILGFNLRIYQDDLKKKLESEDIYF